jgi:3-oxoacyl-[acyl-carrier protein] reductase
LDPESLNRALDVLKAAGIEAVAVCFLHSAIRELLGEKMNRVAENTPLRRVSTIEDVANAVLFLASDEVGTITGDLLHVAGGTHLPASLF